jgi:putative endonuclease
MRVKQYYVYIMTNAKSRTLYVGVTNDLTRRVQQHKRKLVEGFTSEYNVTELVYYEVTDDVHAAIAREKRIKGWVRAKKKALIDSANPTGRDLSAEVSGAEGSPPAGCGR